MQILFNLIGRFGVFFLFVFLEALSFLLIIQNNNFHKSSAGEFFTEITGNVHDFKSRINNVFTIQRRYKKIQEENRYLREKLLLKKNEEIVVDAKNSFLTTDTLSNFQIISASVISNSISKSRNFLILNKGKLSGVEKDMGVITANGLVGVVANVSRNYSIVRSVLNQDQSISAKIDGLNYIGIIKWRGEHKGHQTLNLEEIPTNFEVKKNDIVVSFSSFNRFPRNHPIGKITKVGVDKTSGYLDIEVELFEDISKIKNVYIIKNQDKPEIDSLQSSINLD